MADIKIKKIDLLIKKEVIEIDGLKTKIKKMINPLVLKKSSVGKKKVLKKSSLIKRKDFQVKYKISNTKF
jgi:hypothetical protein